MIVRKPYAFLIKNFKKIHIFLLLLSVFVAYKLFDVNGYVNDFMNYGTYDVFGNPITKHITGWLTLAIILLILGSVAILALLFYKQKPWKIYLVPIIEYIVLLLVLAMIKGFFSGYTNTVDMADLRLTRDLLFIFIVAQFASIGIYIMRIFGLDTKKFQFNFDQEYLELSEEDREEIEIGFNIDKYTLLRGYRRVLRYLKYFYLEHRSICRIVIILIVLFNGFQIWKFFFVTHKSYSLGESYSVNGYTFRINNVYYTDKNFNGKVIDTKNNFVVVDVSVINHAKERTMYLENFHVKNGINDYVTTRRLYASEFQDFGTAYESKRKIKTGERLDFIIIYKVSKKLNKDRFVLYYQENSGILRKIKLKVEDVSSIQKTVQYSLGDELTLHLKKKEETIRFDFVNVLDSVEYVIRNCDTVSCVNAGRELKTDGTYKILEIDFISDDYEAGNMLDFLRNYGKLSYKDNEGEVHVVEFQNPIAENYYGKSVYVRVPSELENASEVYYEFIVRNEHYVYNLF